jgi:GPH family glycoside/pentoside/hexuronide:cation symporter
MKRITQRYHKKRPIIFSFLALGVLMLSSYYMGVPKGVSIPPGGIGVFNGFFRAQGFALAICAAIPLAFMSILPTALIAEISDLDGRQTGQQKEGLYFAVRNLLQKFGQTLGMMVVAIVEIYGMNIGDDLGIRLTGAIGLTLCLAASIIFYFFNETKLDADVQAWADKPLPAERDAAEAAIKTAENSPPQAE